jgi:hypothetical protein
MATTPNTTGGNTMNTTKIHNLTYLAEMMGDETTEQEAEAMRDLLVERNLLEWIGDYGIMVDIDDDEWFSLIVEACKTVAA